MWLTEKLKHKRHTYKQLNHFSTKKICLLQKSYSPWCRIHKSSHALGVKSKKVIVLSLMWNLE